jgi:citrate synthase
MVKAGLEDVVAGESTICFVDGKEGRLLYQGYDIRELVDSSTFEEVVYLLWHGHLPCQVELEVLTRELAFNRALPANVLDVMGHFPKTAAPMEVMRTVVSMLSMYDPDGEDNSIAANLRKAARLTACLPTVVAYWDCIRNGRELVSPLTDCNLASNFLYMLTGRLPHDLEAGSFDKALILHADHELNASTFAARVAASTLSDMYSAAVAGIGTLKGPLHGGANQEVIKMLLEIGDPARAEAYVRDRLSRHEKLMGFGHRVYKGDDPRGTLLRPLADELGKHYGQTQWSQISAIIRKVAVQEKQLHPNLDFYSASLYYLLGIPIDMYTPIFAMGRVAGWTAHVLEQLTHNRLIRPRAEYAGPDGLKYVPLEKRERSEVRPRT